MNSSLSGSAAANLTVLRRLGALAATVIASLAAAACAGLATQAARPAPAPPSAVTPAVPEAMRAKLNPRWQADEDEQRPEDAQFALKHAGNDLQRGSISYTSKEGSPIELERQHAARKAFPAAYLPLEGAANGRAAFAQITAFADADSWMPNAWKSIGPVSAVTPQATSRTNAPFTVSGRITALAMDPRCDVRSAPTSIDAPNRLCRLLVGAAGGGIWRTDQAFSTSPSWVFASGGFLTNAIGTIAISPIDPDFILVGTGEPNASGDSAAGVGLYQSSDGGENWTHLSSLVTYSTVNGPVTVRDGFNNLSISSIAFDPTRPGTYYVATVLGVRGVSATEGAYLAANLALPGLYKTTDGGATFTQIWDGGGANCSPSGGACLTSWGVDKVQLDPADPDTIYASAVDVGLWRSWRADNGGAFTQIFFSQNQANVGSDRTDFALTTLPSGKTRIYVATGATGAFAGYPPPQTAFSQVWRIDNARRPAARLIAEEELVVPGGLAPAPGGWKLLTSANLGDPGYATYDICEGQCWYDIGIYTPPHRPDTVYVVGCYAYGEVYFGPSNGRGVVRSTTAGDPDPKNNNVTFTDLTFDAQTPDPTNANWLTQTNAIHPDQHALVFTPLNPDLWFEGSDGGLVRPSGQYASISSTCPLRGLTGAANTTCEQVLSAVPTRNYSMNVGLVTLQFQNLSINPNNPLGELQGGTQDNGTWQYEGSAAVWDQSVGGDGGLSGFNASDPTDRFHNYYGPNPDTNFAGGDPYQWLFIGGPLGASGENSQFYLPMIADPRPDRGGTIYAGLQSLWATRDNGGSNAFLSANCNEFSNIANPNACGDWQPVSNGVLTATSTVTWVTRTPSDTGTLWAGTGDGGLWIFKNADTSSPSQVLVSSAAKTTPLRFITGIVIDPLNANHGWVSYSGYNSTTVPGSPAVPGHVFEVRWDGVSPTADFRSIDGHGQGALGDLPINSIVRDDLTGDLYVATDFAVLRRSARTGHWHVAAPGMPMVEVSSLSIDSTARVLYAATHGRSAWQLLLPGGGD